MGRFGVFSLEVLISLVLNVTASLFDKPQAMVFSKWGWLIVLSHATYLIGSSRPGRHAAVQVRSLFGRKAMLSYVFIGLISGVLGMFYWMAINATYARLFAGRSSTSSLQHRQEPDSLPVASEFSLSLLCEIFPLPVPYHGELWFLNTTFSPGGLARVTASPAKQDAVWPSEDSQGVGYHCQLTNYGTNALFGISMRFPVVFKDVVRDPVTGTISTGNNVKHQDTVVVSVPRPLGQGESFSFYMCGPFDPEASIGVFLPSIATVSDGKQVVLRVTSPGRPGESLDLLAPRGLSSSPPKQNTSKVAKGTQDDKPPTLTDLFKSGFPNTLRVDGNSWGLVNQKDGTQILNGPTKVYLDFDAKTKFIAFYVPRSEHSYEAALGLWSQVPATFDSVQSKIGVTAGYGQNLTDIKDLTFSGRVFIYHEDMFNLRQLADLVDAYKLHGMALDFRGPTYLSDQVIAWYHQHDAKGAK